MRYRLGSRVLPLHDENAAVFYRTNVALAEQLGTSSVQFPGDHGGFIGQPAKFAATPRTVLAG
jgi:hypothetical protein